MARPLFPWLALGVGVVGIGAAAWSERRGSGSAAVDPVKRYRDLQRVASPSSGATANERAMAQRLLATMTPPAPQRQAPRTPSSGGYGYAPPRRQAQPWQTDPRGSTEIHRNDLTDLNFAKKSIYEHASPPRVRVTVQGFDGRYFRSIFQVFSSLDDLGYAAEVLEAWGLPYFKKDGVFEAVIGRVEGEDQTRILRIRGRDVSGLGLVIQNEDFYDEERFSSFYDQLARHLAARVKAQAQKMR